MGVLQRQDLPAEYTDKSPSMWWDKNEESIVCEINDNRYVIPIGHCIDAKYIDFMKQCKERLVAINKKLKEESGGWYGKDTFII